MPWVRADETRPGASPSGECRASGLGTTTLLSRLQSPRIAALRSAVTSIRTSDVAYHKKEKEREEIVATNVTEVIEQARFGPY
jgi:hypothetical protein